MSNIEKRKKKAKELKKKNNIRKNNFSKQHKSFDTKSQNDQIDQLINNMAQVNQQMINMLTTLDDKLGASVESFKTRTEMFDEDFSEDIKTYEETKASLNEYIVKSEEQFNQLKLFHGMNKMQALEKWLTEAEKETAPLLKKYDEVLDKFQDQLNEEEYSEYKELLNGQRTDNITDEEVDDFLEEANEMNLIASEEDNTN
jgi:hypothetical protein